jgi:hypothetical protein
MKSIRFFPPVRMYAIACFFPALAGAVPLQLNHQGRILDAAGPVNGTPIIALELYDAEVGGTRLYAETQTVTVVDGLYSVLIGASNAVPDALSTALLDADRVFLQLAIDGIVDAFAQVASAAGSALYRAVLVPNMAVLTYSTDSRVFQQQSVPDIINQVLGDRSPRPSPTCSIHTPPSSTSYSTKSPT